MDFSAQWCGPCKAVAPLFAQMADKYKNLLFLKVDVEANQVLDSVLFDVKDCRGLMHTRATCPCTAECQSGGEDAWWLQDIAEECAVVALPTFQIFKDGAKVGEVVGANVRALTALLEEHNAACSVFSGRGRTLAGAPGPSTLVVWPSCCGPGCSCTSTLNTSYQKEC